MTPENQKDQDLQAQIADLQEQITELSLRVDVEEGVNRSLEALIEALLGGGYPAGLGRPATRPRGLLEELKEKELRKNMAEGNPALGGLLQRPVIPPALFGRLAAGLANRPQMGGMGPTNPHEEIQNPRQHGPPPATQEQQQTKFTAAEILQMLDANEGKMVRLQEALDSMVEYGVGSNCGENALLAQYEDLRERTREQKRRSTRGLGGGINV
ncbi:hypothetical protein BKA65DRAFT_549072 [Rhexocercosporidium sp. MPI-PUGE-AT-0058]|nr:hypothetical protein BKA65DRAFT_549072 [Rhexocercosporidium sp. MPI-PUGE-AT-0058]